MRNVPRSVRSLTTKLLFFFLVFVIGTGLSACGSKSQSENDTTGTNAATSGSPAAGAKAQPGQSSARRVSDQAKEDSRTP